MAFFASLALIPFTAAIGGVLGYVERWSGPGGVANVERIVVDVMTVILGPELVTDVAAPFVRAQLEQSRGGLALGGLLTGLWLASRVFLPAVHALDLAYEVTERRGALHRRAIAVGLALASLVVVVLQLFVWVLGPLLGSARELADTFALGVAFEVAWTLGRWPLMGVVLTGFLVALYRLVPFRRLGWRESLPGALFAAGLWAVLAVGFRVYLETGVRPGQGVDLESAALASVGRAVGALVATVLWVFLSSIAVLVGGEINAAIDRRRRDRMADARDQPGVTDAA